MSIPYILTPDSVSVYLDGYMRTVNRSHPNFQDVIGAIRLYQNFKKSGANSSAVTDTLHRLKTLIDIPSFIALCSHGHIVVSDNAVFWKGVPVMGQDVLVARILSMMKNGYPIEPLVRFMDRLMTNPDERVRSDLFVWLEKGNMPIMPDGRFVAFKKVAGDYTSIHTGPGGLKIRNQIGDSPSMNREECDSDPHNTCSAGLHFCSFAYLASYGAGGETRVMTVAIDPADVVAIPDDYGHTKGRTWRYTVIGEVPEHEAKQFFRDAPVTQDDGSPLDEDGDAMPEAMPIRVKEAADAEAKSVTTRLMTKRLESGGSRDKPGKKFLRELQRKVKKLGQREVSRQTGIPRSTLQDWLRTLA